MNTSYLIAAAAALAIAISNVSGAIAAPHLVANVNSVPPGRSDTNMRSVAARAERDVDLLQQDRRDYGGHRAAAVVDLQAARSQIGLGLAYDAGAESKIAALKAALMRASLTALRGECGSDANLKYVRRDVEKSIDVLQRDNADYGGHRVAAIADLQKARQQIVAALIYDATH